jgi:lipopolysaccharide transport system permease protein
LIRQVWSRRQLVMSLILRQYQVRYRQSFIGIVWAIVPPLASLGVAIIVFDRVVGVDTRNTPYAVFTLSALAPWTFFANSISSGIPSVQQSQSMLTRIAFPPIVLPISMIGIALLDLGIATSLFIVVAYIIGDGLPITALWFPALLVIEIVLAVGVALLGSALNVFARDIRLAVPLFVQLWLFLTPVMYPLNEVPADMRPWYLANPMTGLVESFRNVLVYGRGPEARLLLPSVIGAAIVLLIGTWYFRTTQRRFADVI